MRILIANLESLARPEVSKMLKSSLAHHDMPTASRGRKKSLARNRMVIRLISGHVVRGRGVLTINVPVNVVADGEGAAHFALCVGLYLGMVGGAGSILYSPIPDDSKEILSCIRLPEPVARTLHLTLPSELEPLILCLNSVEQIPPALYKLIKRCLGGIYVKDKANCERGVCRNPLTHSHDMVRIGGDPFLIRSAVRHHKRRKITDVNDDVIHYMLKVLKEYFIKFLICPSIFYCRSLVQRTVEVLSNVQLSKNLKIRMNLY